MFHLRFLGCESSYNSLLFSYNFLQHSLFLSLFL